MQYLPRADNPAETSAHIDIRVPSSQCFGGPVPRPSRDRRPPWKGNSVEKNSKITGASIQHECAYQLCTFSV